MNGGNEGNNEQWSRGTGSFLLRDD